ncbi:MAG: sortase [Candidatus Sulfotelmatobacter sp.]
MRALCALLLIAGACLTLRALYLHAKAELARVLIRRAWEQSVRTGEFHAPWPGADTHPIARLRIFRLGYDQIVLEGATPRILAFGPARLFSGTGLGEPGNLLLAGHRTSWFRPLEAIAQGDRIELEWFDPHSGGLHERNYAVDIIRVVDPQDVTLLAPTSEDALTLITCYPFGYGARSPLRYIVRAIPLGPGRLVKGSAAVGRSRQLLPYNTYPTEADSLESRGGFRKVGTRLLGGVADHQCGKRCSQQPDD